MKNKKVKPIRVMPQVIENGTVLDGIRRDVFIDRYSLKDEAGSPLEEYPEQMWRRVAKGVARTETSSAKREEWEKKFESALQDFKFVPGGRILSGAGTGFDVTFYNCYVLPSPKDSRDGIIDNLKEMIEIMSRGGGVGINLSSLRPRGARVKKVNGFSSGPLNWAELYSVATHDIIQQGGTRRGALMLMLWDWHPDIEELITVKKDLSRINGANLSVCVSDRFMRAVKNNEDWPLLFPDLDDPQYDAKWDGIIENWIEAGGKVKIYKTLRARELWEMIAQAAWESAEPGVVFMERYNKWHNNYYFNKINCVNPCGEEGLPAYGVCNLGSINLVSFVKEGGSFDFNLLEEVTRTAVRFLDNVVDCDIYIFEEIKKAQLEGERRIGLGTMGLGDVLIKMKIRYGSEKSLEVIEKIYKTIRDTAYDASSDLAKEKEAFPKFDPEKYTKSYFVSKLPESLRKKIKKQGVRNSVILMQAPTGSTSLMAGVTSGIEPVFEFSYVRRDRLGEHVIYHPMFDAWRKEHPGEEKPDYFVSAQELTPEAHVKVQATIQKYVDASISKTVNAPETFTVNDVKRLYTMAYDLGCKGIAFMRSGSRPGVLESLPEKKTETPIPKEEVLPPQKEKIPQPVYLSNGDMLVKRPFVVKGSTYRLETPVGTAFITINESDDRMPLEVFVNVGKAGSDVAAMAEALGRTISTALRFRGSLSSQERAREIAKQLAGIGGRRSVGFGPNKIRSLPDAISFAFASHYGFKLNGDANHVASTPYIEAGAVMVAQSPAQGQTLTGFMVDPVAAPAPIDIAKAETNGTNGHTVINGNGESHLISDKPLEESAVPQIILPSGQPAGDICPSCGASSLVYEEGCAKCYSCGHAEC